jgi:hypothetical protein
MLMKKSSPVSEQVLRQMCAAAADMLDSDCALHGVDLGGDSLSSFWPPLLRKCSGYSSVLHIMRNGHKDVLQRVSPGNIDNSKRKPPLLLYCVENRETRMQPGSRPLIDITDIKFPSPRRMYVATSLFCASLTIFIAVLFKRLAPLPILHLSAPAEAVFEPEVYVQRNLACIFSIFYSKACPILR